MSSTLHRFIFVIFDIFKSLFLLHSLQLNRISGSLTFFFPFVGFGQPNHKCKIHILSIRWSTVDNVWGPSINYVVSRVEGGGQKLQILHSKKRRLTGGGGQKFLILRRHSLWSTPKVKMEGPQMRILD
mgnify:CR=1 FL=1